MSIPASDQQDRIRELAKMAQHAGAREAVLRTYRLLTANGMHDAAYLLMANVEQITGEEP